MFRKVKDLYINSTMIIDRSKHKRIKKFVHVRVDVILNNDENHSVLFSPDHNFNLVFNKKAIKSIFFIDDCNKRQINPDNLANKIKEKSMAQYLWKEYVNFKY
jgi:hypothetical protein